MSSSSFTLPMAAGNITDDGHELVRDAPPLDHVNMDHVYAGSSVPLSAVGSSHSVRLQLEQKAKELSSLMNSPSSPSVADVSQRPVYANSHGVGSVTVQAAVDREAQAAVSALMSRRTREWTASRGEFEREVSLSKTEVEMHKQLAATATAEVESLRAQVEELQKNVQRCSGLQDRVFRLEAELASSQEEAVKTQVNRDEAMRGVGQQAVEALSGASAEIMQLQIEKGELERQLKRQASRWADERVVLQSRLDASERGTARQASGAAASLASEEWRAAQASSRLEEEQQRWLLERTEQEARVAVVEAQLLEAQAVAGGTVDALKRQLELAHSENERLRCDRFQAVKKAEQDAKEQVTAKAEADASRRVEYELTVKDEEVHEMRAHGLAMRAQSARAHAAVASALAASKLPLSCDELSATKSACATGNAGIRAWRNKIRSPKIDKLKQTIRGLTGALKNLDRDAGRRTIKAEDR